MMMPSGLHQSIDEDHFDVVAHEPHCVDAGSSLHPAPSLRCCQRIWKLLLKVTLDHAVSMQAEACIEILECGEAVAVGNRVCSDFAGPA